MASTLVPYSTQQEGNGSQRAARKERQEENLESERNGGLREPEIFVSQVSAHIGLIPLGGMWFPPCEYTHSFITAAPSNVLDKRRSTALSRE